MHISRHPQVAIAFPENDASFLKSVPPESYLCGTDRENILSTSDIAYALYHMTLCKQTHTLQTHARDTNTHTIILMHFDISNSCYIERSSIYIQKRKGHSDMNDPDSMIKTLFLNTCMFTLDRSKSA